MTYMFIRNELVGVPDLAALHDDMDADRAAIVAALIVAFRDTDFDRLLDAALQEAGR